jgi:hypothetical protein
LAGELTPLSGLHEFGYNEPDPPMKTTLISILVLLTGGIVAFAQSPAKSPLEGTWEIVSFKAFEDGKEVSSMPGTFTGQQLKVYSKEHYLFVGHFKDEKGESDSFGGGTYSLTGENYVENRLSHVAKERVGKSVHYKLVIKNDTRTMSGPLLPQEEKLMGARIVETYKRKD